MIGNDVVDLDDAETQPGSAHPRFDARVFAAEERAALAASPSPHRLRWILWAAKEAAYKVARKLDASTVFSPSRFVVRVESNVVEHEARRYRLQVLQTSDWVHALACDDVGRGFHPPPTGPSGPVQRGDLKARIFSGAHAPLGVPWKARPTSFSLAVREIALDALAAALDEEPRELAIVTRNRIPQVERRGAPAPVDLSLSHHGRFVAYAFEVRAGGEWA
jgi:phosphopantetheinyl transferase (holo-ACP synthase)